MDCFIGLKIIINFYLLDTTWFEKHLRCLCIHYTAREPRLEVGENTEIRENKRMQNGVQNETILMMLLMVVAILTIWLRNVDSCADSGALKD